MISALQIASGISSILGLAAFLGVLFTRSTIRRDESGIYQAVRGMDATHPEAIVNILTTFSDDGTRLQALIKLLGGDEKKSAKIIALVKDNIDVHIDQVTRSRRTLLILVIFGCVFLALAVIGGVFSFLQVRPAAQLASVLKVHYNYVNHLILTRTAELTDVKKEIEAELTRKSSDTSESGAESKYNEPRDSRVEELRRRGRIDYLAEVESMLRKITSISKEFDRLNGQALLSLENNDLILYNSLNRSLLTLFNTGDALEIFDEDEILRVSLGIGQYANPRRNNIIVDKPVSHLATVYYVRHPISTELATRMRPNVPSIDLFRTVAPRRQKP
jgi:hypothetical protein